MARATKNVNGTNGSMDKVVDRIGVDPSLSTGENVNREHISRAKQEADDAAARLAARKALDEQKQADIQAAQAAERALNALAASTIIGDDPFTSLLREEVIEGARINCTLDFGPSGAALKGAPAYVGILEDAVLAAKERQRNPQNVRAFLKGSDGKAKKWLVPASKR